jgi:predicted MFS family arabinose efflux permease
LTSTNLAQAGTPSPRAIALAGLFGLALAMGVGRFAFTPLFPLMRADAGVSLAAGAWLAAANYFGYLVGALAALAAKGKATIYIRAALLVTAIATLGMGLADALPAWLVLRWTAGFASAFLLIFISAWSLERLSAARSPLLSAAVFSGVGAGICVVGVSCVVMMLLGVRWWIAWIVLGVLSLVASMAIWRVFRGAAQPQRNEQRMQIVMASCPGRWRVVACYGLFGFGYIIPATFLPVMAKAGGAQGWLLDMSWPLFGAAACLSTFLAAHLSGRGSQIALWRRSQLLMAFGVALPAFNDAPAAMIAAALCVGGTFMIVTMAGMQTARELGTRAPRRLMAAMTAAFATGQLAGPILVPFTVGADADFSAVLSIAAATLVFGACLLPARRQIADAAHMASVVPKEKPL